MMGFERVVSSEREVTFYRDLLGLQVGGVTFNIPEEAQAQLGFKKAVMVRDPSGHAIRLVEE